MSRLLASIVLITLTLGVVHSQCWAQEDGASPPVAAETAPPEAGVADVEKEKEATPPAKEEAPSAEVSHGEASDATHSADSHLSGQLEDIAKSVDESDTAKETSAGILTPIYQVAEALEFPAFHWIAFSLMLAGVVGFALQLVIGKLVVFSHFGFSLREILSDLLGFAISVVGLVLTTQAAAQNSTFTQSPFAVLSASAFGLIIGLLLYIWGQSQEVEAVKGRVAAAKEKKVEKK
ncbi:hypothetical protein LOC68_26575 [Blastopirellula sp. JC732]|uniref:Uncharacterized protein n=1 Tax=Blastopirellula sediminis TaxID=2894196 RepID=A0A9X1SJ52_9BACT|nr:hypothetical protein [Blastopirellula sediminis]MCC9604724.1 hypothetical protein [Blastopirellula sediminis]MCC9631977.1 hypothetical protein [Blastopirellula sediminis]